MNGVVFFSGVSIVWLLALFHSTPRLGRSTMSDSDEPGAGGPPLNAHELLGLAVADAPEQADDSEPGGALSAREVLALQGPRARSRNVGKRKKQRERMAKQQKAQVLTHSRKGHARTDDHVILPPGAWKRARVRGQSAWRRKRRKPSSG